MSVDPLITDPTDGQSLNPYSYVMNNPLKYTDPSGYSWDVPSNIFRGCVLWVCSDDGGGVRRDRQEPASSHLTDTILGPFRGMDNGDYVVSRLLSSEIYSILNSNDVGTGSTTGGGDKSKKTEQKAEWGLSIDLSVTSFFMGKGNKGSVGLDFVFDEDWNFSIFAHDKSAEYKGNKYEERKAGEYGGVGAFFGFDIGTSIFIDKDGIMNGTSLKKIQTDFAVVGEYKAALLLLGGLGKNGMKKGLKTRQPKTDNKDPSKLRTPGGGGGHFETSIDSFSAPVPIIGITRNAGLGFIADGYASGTATYWKLW